MLDPITLKLNVDPLILSALSEDINNEDVSTNSVMPENVVGQVDLICKEDGIICGLSVFERVFYLLDSTTTFDVWVKDGEAVKAGQHLGTVRGDIRVLLSGKRTSLNYLQRMSGIATYTHEMAELLKDTPITLLDSRKTTPNNRIFEKYAVKVGGGKNHRYNLSDGALLKDNHIGAAGGVKEAVLAAKNYAPSVRKIEIEVETIEMVKEAVEAGADIIMLDNMDHDTMKEAVTVVNGKAEIEISGNVTKENLASYIDLNVQYVSSRAITHSAKILDLSLKNLHPVDN
ncbi:MULTISPECIES: carboxylating nicotinate-nucleotide diphosphorylase [Streptococcus]|nr:MULTISPECIES: carboxylating nicotinate-nucleotide diphosphorylase [Streptococcus]KEH51574.1 nicotinate-nucleotide pyrophosphorylase [Streptococcus macedonicus]PHV55831.1 nicotinate-nucleotide diphosphorylase (carboxylating) [Streptococcus macedonicus]WGK80339.1 carboxylating nicotinate-nucleotide diphosphorylase [Streptococcus macedonicus]SUN58671.1 Nicotinate-nucleotide pyrophosphorylase [Streptococcus gallolyticus]